MFERKQWAKASKPTKYHPLLANEILQRVDDAKKGDKVESKPVEAPKPKGAKVGAPTVPVSGRPDPLKTTWS